MPPRVPLHIRASLALFKPSPSIAVHRSYAVAATTTYFPPTSQFPSHSPTQPPSHRAPASRKTQLHRIYLSILRSTPLMLLFQHNNLRAVEWTALRRELSMALDKLVSVGEVDAVAEGTKVMVLRGGVFAAALRVAEYYDLKDGALHGTSKEAYDMTKRLKRHPLEPLFAGPVGMVIFPAVSPIHLKTVMDIMFPDGRAIKGMDPAAVSGLQKLVLLAARVDGHLAAGTSGVAQILDSSKAKWISELPGFEGLRGQLVGMLQNVGGADLVRSLEAIPISIVRTIDGHRKVLSGELGDEVDKVEDGGTEGKKPAA